MVESTRAQDGAQRAKRAPASLDFTRSDILGILQLYYDNIIAPSPPSPDVSIQMQDKIR